MRREKYPRSADLFYWTWDSTTSCRLFALRFNYVPFYELIGYFWIFHYTEFYVKLFLGHSKLNPNSKNLWIHHALHPLFGCPWQKLNARSYPKLTLYIFLITITGLVTDIRQTTFWIVMKLFLIIYWKAMKISHDCLQLKVQQTPRHPDYICLKVQIPTIKILFFICPKLCFL